MLNVGLLTLSASSLERRIVVMRVARGRPGLRAGLMAIGAVALLGIACATRMAPVSSGALASQSGSNDPDIVRMRQIALQQLGGKLKNGHQYWALFNADWTLNRFDASTEGAVLMSDRDVELLRLGDDRFLRPPYYHMQESLFNKFPALADYREPDYPIYGAFDVISGSDTAVVNWGHLGPDR